uniref:Uncharacterized protein n=1 Tax=viral metagenome TaxID=1070528 RepID=A0A6C0AD81_9ZZZZ
MSKKNIIETNKMNKVMAKKIKVGDNIFIFKEQGVVNKITKGLLSHKCLFLVETSTIKKLCVVLNKREIVLKIIE